MTVEEALLQSGMTQEEIKALDARVLQAGTKILSSAEEIRAAATAEREKAELAQRAVKEEFDNNINPALNAWGNEKTQLEAQVEFYKKQLEGAKASGFLPAEAPTTPPAAVRAEDGKFVAGKTGSPQYITPQDFYTGATNIFKVQNEYFRLFGGPIPDDVDALVREAAEARLPLVQYAEKKYDFQKKRDERAAAEKAKERQAIVKETEDRVLKEVAERSGSNGNLNPAVASQFSSVRKGVEAGKLPDPLKLSKEDRHLATQRQIQSEIADNAAKTIVQ